MIASYHNNEIIYFIGFFLKSMHFSPEFKQAAAAAAKRLSGSVLYSFVF